ncbi:hypothetical protein ABK040_002810 [Willaertia magna]
MRISLLYENGVLNTLLQIPELIDLIFQFLDIRTLSKVEMSSKNTFQHVFTNINFWTSLAIKYNADEVEDEKEEDDEEEEKESKEDEADVKDKEEINKDMKENEKLTFIKELKQKIINCYLNPTTLIGSDTEDDEENPITTNYSVEISKSNRAGCRYPRCGEKIPKDVMRGVVQIQNDDYYHENTNYYHWDCFKEYLKGENKVTINDIGMNVSGKNKELVIEYFKERRREKLRKEGNLESDIPFVYCCDSCSRLISSNRNYIIKNNISIDYCLDCFQKRKDKKDKDWLLDKDVVTFVCNRCSKVVKNCIFHCKSCEDHNICDECFAQLMKKPEKRHEHCFFFIGKSSLKEFGNQNGDSLEGDNQEEEVNHKKRKECINDSDSTLKKKENNKLNGFC